MVNVDMCRHEWPGSGCRDCREEAALGPMAEALYNVKPDYETRQHKIEWRYLSDRRQDDFRRLARAASVIEARSDATGTGAAEGESAVPQGDAQ